MLIRKLATDDCTRLILFYNRGLSISIPDEEWMWWRTKWLETGWSVLWPVLGHEHSSIFNIHVLASKAISTADSLQWTICRRNTAVKAYEGATLASEFPFSTFQSYGWNKWHLFGYSKWRNRRTLSDRSRHWLENISFLSTYRRWVVMNHFKR